MSTRSPTILFIDDDADIQKAARMLLERRGMRVVGAPDPDTAWTRLAEQPVDMILLDLNFARGRTSGEEGFAMLGRLIAADRDAVVVVVTGHSGINVAVQAMRAGASDFVIKPWNNDKLIATVERAIALRQGRIDAAALPTEPTEDRLLLGGDPAIARVRDLIARVAPTDAAVLVRGPAGCGKSLVARLIHHGSALADRPMVTLTAATVAGREMLIDRVTEARGATLLIDEVTAMPRALQPALAERLTEIRTIATSRLGRGELRATLDEDLRYRLDTIEIALPPLAERSDVLLLARHFLDLFAARYGKPAKPLSDEAARAIAADVWGDDVRGLRQAMERAVLLGTGEEHGLDDFAFAVETDDPIPRALAPDLNLSRGERTLVEAALHRHAFNVSRAAAELGLTRAALYRRMAKYGL